MGRLDRETFEAAKSFIKEEARPLERYRFEHSLQNGKEENVAEALKMYQNEDGGFGNGLEPDFRLPDSSPIATSIGLRYLKEVDTVPIPQNMIEEAVDYLEHSFVEDRDGWFAVPEEVNDHPHAWWWHHDGEMTIIDKSWGNPSAEIIAYLYRYRNYTDNIDVDRLIDRAIQNIKSKEEFGSENEIYCYIKLYEEIPKDKARIIEKQIRRGVEQLVVYDRDKWDEYVPKPLDFATSENNFGVDEEMIEKNLEYLIDELEEKKILEPSWDTSVYEGVLSDAYKEWKGILTLEALETLKDFDRIER